MVRLPNPDKTAPKLAFRHDIEGLRGVAILLVVAYHAGLPGFSGGYIGVDIFFVLSGYLITRLLVNEVEAKGKLDKAIKVYTETLELIEDVGAVDVAIRVWNNLGVCYEAHDIEQARHAYAQSLKLAQQSGESHMIAVSLANRAALDEDLPAWEEAMHMLEAAGHTALVKRFWEQLPETHSFRLVSDLKK